jgi:stage IV sporulation protein FB
VGSLLSSRVKVFRVAGIDVYLHAVFIIVAFFEALRGFSEGTPAWTLTWLGSLWVSVLLHEFGHCWGARKVGGDAREILLWPLGGLAMVDAPMTPRAQFVTTACGPLVNLVLAGLGILVGHFGQGTPVWYLVRGWGTSFDWVDFAIPIFVNTNVALFAFNMLPAFPMDMGRIFQVALWTRMGYQRSMRIACYVSFVCAAGLSSPGSRAGGRSGAGSWSSSRSSWARGLSASSSS